MLGISRSGIYTLPTPVSGAELQFRAILDRLYTDHPYYGQRRMSVVLERDHGIKAGRDRIRTAMNAMGLEAIYCKPNTSIPHPGHAVYPYLLRGVIADHPNHIWGTDITYIPIVGGFCYLVALLDWYSRYVVAWTLSPNMEVGFCTENLQKGLMVATPEIHNSDQGSQFTCGEYLEPLREGDIAISMDGRGRCMDNIFTERLWRTIKYEDVYIKGYATFAEAQVGIGEYLRFYNEKRPHQSLEYQTPKSVYFAEKA